MELLMHALLGAAIGEALLGKRLGNRALAWGALAGVLPYLDAMATPFLDTAAILWWDRGPSHSIFVVLMVVLLVAKPMAKLWKREKISPTRAGTFVFLALCAHVLMDCMRPVAVAVFWPLPVGRISFGNLSPGDPLLILPLLVCIPWLAFLRKPKQRRQRIRLLRSGTALCAAYAGLTIAMKFTASDGFTADLANRSIHEARLTLVPAPHSSLAWRAVVDLGDELMIGHRSVFQKNATPVRWVVFPRGIPADSPITREREVHRIKTFTDGYWIASPHKRGLWITDLRGGETHELKRNDAMVDFRMMRAWNFEPNAPKDRLISASAKQPGMANRLRKTSLQIIGQADGVNRTPHLAGVPGHFPIPLRVLD